MYEVLKFSLALENNMPTRKQFFALGCSVTMSVCGQTKWQYHWCQKICLWNQK